MAPFQGTRLPPASDNLVSYRSYAAEQAEMLVRMTRMLAAEIAEGHVEAAQNDYAMTHRYLERIRPATSLFDRDLDQRLDALPKGARSETSEADLHGFHRLELGLFAARSTNGLSIYADRLVEDVRLLRTEVADWPMPSDALLDRAAETMATLSVRTLGDGSEPYSRTDLWDIEASLDGTREIVAALKPRLEARDPILMARITNALTAASERLSRFEEGCGYKSFDELTRADKDGLSETTAALARELFKLKLASAID